MASQSGAEPKDPLTGATAYAITAPTVASAPSRSLPSTKHKQIWFVIGPAGCGKSTIAAAMAQTYGLPYLEGDSFHPPANIAKMAAGHPLVDEDRWSWLGLIRDTAVTTASSAQGVVITCSALKKSYRDMLRGAASGGKVHFMYLALTAEELVRRVESRQGHYMKAEMVRSQLAALDEPDAGEVERDTTIVDAGRDLGAVQADVLKVFEKTVSKEET